MVGGTRSLFFLTRVFWGFTCPALAHAGRQLCISYPLCSKLIVANKASLGPGSPTHPCLNLFSVFGCVVKAKYIKAIVEAVVNMVYSHGPKPITLVTSLLSLQAPRAVFAMPQVLYIMLQIKIISVSKPLIIYRKFIQLYCFNIILLLSCSVTNDIQKQCL